MAGLSCAVGILAAYSNRLKNGEGEKVDISLVDSMVSSLEIINMIYLCTGRIPDRIGNRYEAIYPYDTFGALDGDVVIACGNDKLYNCLKDALKISALEDEKFSTNAKRVENHAPLREIVEAWTSERNIDDIVELLLSHGIPSAPINTIDRVVKDPHIAGAREMFVECEHPVGGKVFVTGSHLKFSNRKAEVRSPSPTLGQHNAEVLGEMLGYSAEQVDKLHEDGVI